MANDAVSSTESVVEILEGVFALPTTAALYATYETHYCGFGWVGRWSRETAGELVHRARERAAARQSPLTFVTEEAADG